MKENVIRIVRTVLKESPHFLILRIMADGNILKNFFQAKLFRMAFKDTWKLLFNLFPFIKNFPDLVDGVYALITAKEICSR